MKIILFTIFSSCSTYRRTNPHALGSHASATAAPGSSVLRGRSIPKGPKVSSTGSCPLLETDGINGSNHLNNGEQNSGFTMKNDD